MVKDAFKNEILVAITTEITPDFEITNRNVKVNCKNKTRVHLLKPFFKKRTMLYIISDFISILNKTAF